MKFSKNMYINTFGLNPTDEFLFELEFIENLTSRLKDTINLEYGYDTMSIIFLKLTNINDEDTANHFINLDFYPYNSLQFQFVSGDEFLKRFIKQFEDICNLEFVINEDGFVIVNTGKIELNKDTELVIAGIINEYF